LAHDFHALLTAELADTAGWDLLVGSPTSSAIGRGEGFRQRHREEQEHVLFVGKVVEQFVKRSCRSSDAGDVL